MLGWFRRFCPPPPPLVWFVVRRPPLFFSLALSGFARSGPGVLVLVFSLSSLLLRSPLCVLLSNCSFHFHFHFTSISSSLSFSSHVRSLVFYPTAVGCVCVYHLNRCKTSNIAGGSSTIASLLPTKTLAFGGDIWPDQPDVPAFFNLPFFPKMATG